MGARQRLNGIFFSGAVLIAAVPGGVTGSWPVFFIALGVSVAGLVISEDIRLKRRQ